MKLYFRATTSFNSYDSSVNFVNGRIQVSNGVAKRLELVFQEVLKSKKPIDVETLTRRINEDTSDSYSVGDIAYALERLHRHAQVIEKRKDGYVAIPSAKKLWNNIEKIQSNKRMK